MFIRKITAIMLTLVLLMSCVPAVIVNAASDTPAIGDKLMVAVNDSLNMRSGPSTDHPVITKLPAGVIVTLSGEYGTWAQVTYGQYTGWVASRYLVSADFASTDYGDILTRMDELRVKFPDGKYWNHYGSDSQNLDGWTETPCPSNYGHLTTQWCNGQCDGFARKLGLDLFGLSSYKWEKRDTLDGLCIGDIIRYGNKHTVMVTGFTTDDNYIIIADCNWQYTCNIDWDREFSLSRYVSGKSFYVLHYPGNTLTKQALIDYIAGMTGTTTTTTAATTTTTDVAVTTTTEAVTTTIAAASSGTVNADIVRIGGNDYYQTAALISKSGWRSSDAVVIASSVAFADALAGAPLAYALDAPILYTDGKSLSAHTLNEIVRIGATEAYILGGDAAVGLNVEEQLEANGLSVSRIYGKDRFKTAEEIARVMDEKGIVRSDTVFFTNGFNYPDALSVSSIAALMGSPILYTPVSGSLRESTVECVESIGFAKGTVLGGDAAVGNDVYADIEELGLEVSRCGGKDRYETSLNICWKYRNIFDEEAVCFATGQDYPDALAGGVFAAKQGSPMVLIDRIEKTEAVRPLVRDIRPETVYVFGSEATVAESVIEGCL